MVTVYTKEELKAALRRKETRIVCKGRLAEGIRKKRKIKKTCIVGGAVLTAAGIAASPFTGGASLGFSAMGLAATGLTIGSLTLSAVELAMILGFGLAVYGIHKGCKVKFNKDGSVEIDPSYASR